MPAMSDEMIIQDREELIYLLCEAAEFEHTVMCSYLYAQWTLKRGLDEGVTPIELAAIERWRRSLAQVALEEMLHLSLVNNLLVAIGAAPHLWRPAFPVRPGHFPADVLMSLTPFGEAALDHFMYIERPEGLEHRRWRRLRPRDALPAHRASGHAGSVTAGLCEPGASVSRDPAGPGATCASSLEKNAYSSATARRRSASRSSACRACSRSPIWPRRAAPSRKSCCRERVRQRIATTRTSPASRQSEPNWANCAPHGQGSNPRGRWSAIRCWVTPASRATACASSNRSPGK